MTRSLSSNSTPSQKRRAPSLPLDSSDPLNALPHEPPARGTTETNGSPLRSLADTLEGSYKLLWSKVVALPNPPRTLEDVRKLISAPFAGAEGIPERETREGKEMSSPAAAAAGLGRLIVGSGGRQETIVTMMDDPGRGNLMYLSFLSFLSPLPPDPILIPCRPNSAMSILALSLQCQFILCGIDF